MQFSRPAPPDDGSVTKIAIEGSNRHASAPSKKPHGAVMALAVSIENKPPATRTSDETTVKLKSLPRDKFSPRTLRTCPVTTNQVLKKKRLQPQVGKVGSDPSSRHLRHDQECSES